MTTPIEFPTIHSSAEQSFAYWGPNEGWYMVYSQHRDSDTIERSNWQVMSEDMVARFPDDVRIERFSNWLVGWSDHLLVRPGSPAVAAAQEYTAKLARYPLLDEELYGLMEFDEEWCIRCDRGMRKEHPLMDRHGHMCKFRSESDREQIGYHWDKRHER